MKIRPILLISFVFLCAASCRRTSSEPADKLWEQGKRLLDAGDARGGLIPLERARRQDPHNEEGLVYLARAYIQTGEPRKASELLAEHLANRPGQASTWYMLALARYNERKFDAAVESLEEALRISPRFPEAVLLLGTIYEEYEEIPAAIQAYSQVAGDLSLGPPLVPILLRLCRLLEKNPAADTPRRVENYLLSALSLEPDSAEVLEALGNHYMAQKRPAEALKHFEQWVKRHPGDARAHDHAGLALAAAGQHEAAVESYRKAVEIQRDEADFHLHLADSYKALGQKENYYKALVAASAADPSNTQVKWRLLPFYIEKGRHQTAQTLFGELEKERAMDPEYHRLRSEFHQARGEYRLAYDAHMSILALSGRSPDDAFQRDAGFLARYAGLYEKAVEILTPLAKSYPEDARLQMELGLALWFSGKTAEGLQMVQKAGTPLARIWTAHLLLQSPGGVQAAENALAAIEPEKGSPDERLFYLDVQAQILRAKKDLAGAAAVLDKALPLARNEEERNTLQLAIDELRKNGRAPGATPNSPKP